MPVSLGKHVLTGAAVPLNSKIAALVFGLALVHALSSRQLNHLAVRFPRHAGVFRLLGEVEVVFGFWAIVLLLAMAWVDGAEAALGYAESRRYTEPLFVFTVMVVAASRPLVEAVGAGLAAAARRMPLPEMVAMTWLALAAVPLLGSLITEPAAMTLAALVLAPRVFINAAVPQRLKYLALGTLLVNVSIGGTLTAYAAPPVVMVAGGWQWDSAFMLSHFGWKAALAVVVNASVATLALRADLARAARASESARVTTPPAEPVPWPVVAVHTAFVVGVVLAAHRPVVFVWLFLMFLGFTQAYERWQSPLILKEGLLVGLFLAGLVVLGGMQQWWLEPLIASLSPTTLFFGAVGLTSIADNAALTYLGSLIPDLSEAARYSLVAGAVAGGGLTVIANAPNPVGAALLRRGFEDESIGAGRLFVGALLPTCVAVAAFLIL